MPVPVEFDFVADGAQAQAEAAKTSASFDNIGKAGNSGANAAKAGLTNLEKAANTTAAAVGSSSSAIAQNKTAIAGWDKEIAQARGELAQMSQRLIEVNRNQGAGSQAARDLRGQMATLAASTRTLSAEKALLVQETRGLVIDQKAAEISSTATAGGFSRLTSQLNTGQGALRGYDAVIQGVVRSMGGIQLGWAVLISLSASLIPALLNLGKSKEELVVVSQEEIITNELVALSYQRIQSGASLAAQGYFQFEASARAVSDAQLSTNLIAIEKAQKGVEDTSQLLASTFRELQRDQERVFVTEADLIPQTGRLQSAIGDQSQELGKHQKALAENLSSLRLIQDAFGITNEALLDLARRTGQGGESLNTLRRALDSDIDSLRKFSEELGRTERGIFNVERAAIQLSIALQQIKAPRINIEGLQGVEGAAATLGRGISVLESGVGPQGPVVGTTARREQALALRQDTEALIETAKRQAATFGHTDAERRKLYQGYVNELNPAQRELVKIVQDSEQGMKAFSEAKRGAAGAARSLALAENELARKIKEARSALEGDTFAQRESKINAEIEGERKALAIKKRLNSQTQNDLGTLQKLQIQKVSADRQEAAARENREVERMQIDAIASENDRRKAAIDFEVREKQIGLQRLFGNVKQVEELVDEFRRAKLQQFLNWQLAQWKTHLIQQRSAREALEKEFFETQRRRRLDEQRDSRREQEALFNRKRQQENDAVARSFGFVASNAEAYQLQLESLRRLESGDNFGGLVTGLQAVAQEYLFSAEAAGRWADALGGAFQQVGAGTATFGQAMKAAIFGMIGDMAAAGGRWLILWGIGHILFDPVRGAAAIAAGAALQVFAGFMHSKAQASSKQDSAAAGAGGGAAAASAGGGGAAERAGTPRREVAFNTSGADPFRPFVGASRGGDASFSANFRLDRGGTKDFFKEMLDGEGVITKRNAKTQHVRVLREAVA